MTGPAYALPERTRSAKNPAGQVFADSLNYVTRTFGWFYMLAVASFLVFITLVAFSKWGNIKLGSEHASPQYSFPSRSSPSPS